MGKRRKDVMVMVEEFNGFYNDVIEVSSTLEELKKVLEEHFVLYKCHDGVLIAVGTYLKKDKFFRERITIEAWEWEEGDKRSMIVRMYSKNKEFLEYFLKHLAERLKERDDND